MCMFMCRQLYLLPAALTRARTHSHLRTHSLAFTHSSIQLRIPSRTYSCTQSHFHSLTRALALSLTHSCSYSRSYAVKHSFLYCLYRLGPEVLTWLSSLLWFHDCICDLEMVSLGSVSHCDWIGSGIWYKLTWFSSWNCNLSRFYGSQITCFINC